MFKSVIMSVFVISMLFTIGTGVTLLSLWTYDQTGSLLITAFVFVLSQIIVGVLIGSLTFHQGVDE